jgi:hypothetical protein
MSLLRTALVASVVLLVTSCSSTSPTEPGIVTADGGMSLPSLCVEGCLDEDPAPNAAGYFLPGTENQAPYCADGSIDLDQDGLDDNCEFTLAALFAPLLSIGIGDYADRESRWAARWAGPNLVSIIYLLGYYQDNGTPGGNPCQVFYYACDPHPGDSEYIVLNVGYDDDTHHWSLREAVLSAHTWHVELDITGSDTVPRTVGNHHTGVGFEYPGRVGGFPRVWVADGKHANYPTKSYCDGHGGEAPGGIILSTDSCSNPRTEARVTVGTTLNVGSDSHRLADCVTANNPNHPAYALQIQECFWSTGRNFFGWFNFNNNTYSTEYGAILRAHGF